MDLRPAELVDIIRHMKAQRLTNNLVRMNQNRMVIRVTDWNQSLSMKIGPYISCSGKWCAIWVTEAIGDQDSLKGSIFL